MSSTSAGVKILVKTSGVSMVDPRLSGRYFLLKFKNASSMRSTHASSPSQSRRVLACNKGWAKSPWVWVNPMMRAIMPALVWGASAMVKCPTRSWAVLQL